jgi:hypothetical protein
LHVHGCFFNRGDNFKGGEERERKKLAFPAGCAAMAAMAAPDTTASAGRKAVAAMATTLHVFFFTSYKSFLSLHIKNYFRCRVN